MNREEFKASAKKSIDDIFQKIDQLETRKDHAKEEVKIKYDEKIAELKKKKDEILERYNDLSNAAEDKWEETKNAFSSASDSFREGFQKIWSLFD